MKQAFRQALYFWLWRRFQGVWRRWSLWTILVLLVASMLVTLVWLAGRYEASSAQDKVERDTADAVADIRMALGRNLQDLHALHAVVASDHQSWEAVTDPMMRAHREWVRLEWRDAKMRLIQHADSPYLNLQWGRESGEAGHADIALACANARRLSGPAYSGSYYQLHGDGLGSEMLELCVPLSSAGRITGYLIATHSLRGMLSEWVMPSLGRHQEVSFTEPDGSRLAMLGATRRGTRMFSAQQLFTLPGGSLMVRLDSWHRPPDLFPNVLTALVTAMSIALVSVVAVLVRDNRRRLRAERELGEALAFRKAMEDSLETGLRARDLQGRITYVNPAFCKMVGFTPQELLGLGAAPPYWPPEMHEEFEVRRAQRVAGMPPPREGFESIFMHRDGTRFPVLVIEAPLINAVGQHTGWMSAMVDLREQRRIEEVSRATQERLQASSRLAIVGEAASMLSHELNQPLAAISSYAIGSLNLLDASDSSPHDGMPPLSPQEREADLRIALRRIADQAERAGRVIKSVHDFVRRREQRREPIGAWQILESVMPLVNLQARKLNVRVKVQVDTALPLILCDRTMVEQVVLNLTRNAMQAMDDPAIMQRTLNLRVQRSNDRSHKGWLEFTVTDVGCGIPEEVAQQLFTPFFTTRREGMGLGLSLCRTVVEQHGGFLSYQPNQPSGTVFSFTLPTVAPETGTVGDSMNGAEPVATTQAVTASDSPPSSHS